MALNFPDPAVTNPWNDGERWWNHDGDGWLRSIEQPASTIFTGYKNVLMNSYFHINQRSFNNNWEALPDYDFGYDRWRKHIGGFKYQTIELTNLINGAEYILSWEGNADAFINDGNDVLIAIGPSPLRFTMAFGGDRMYVGFYDFYSYNTQLELGSVQTAMEQRPIQLEALLCFRYFWKLKRRIIATPYKNSTISLTRSVNIIFPIIMTRTPAIIDATYAHWSSDPIFYGDNSTGEFLGDGLTAEGHSDVQCTFDAEI